MELASAIGLDQLRRLDREQRRVARLVAGASFLVIGIAGETLPGASSGRAVPVEWWNWVTLLLAPALIGLIAATYVGARREEGRGGKASTGAGGLVATAAIACPACSPLAIPLFGAAGVLSVLAPERWLFALLSVALLALTLTLRLRASRVCEIGNGGPS